MLLIMRSFIFIIYIFQLHLIIPLTNVIILIIEFLNFILIFIFIISLSFSLFIIDFIYCIVY